MKKLFLILLILFSVNVFASGPKYSIDLSHWLDVIPLAKTNPDEHYRYLAYDKNGRPYTIHIIGTGSGSVSVTSMSGFYPGDELEIATQTGTYTSLTLTGLNNLLVTAQSGRPVFTTEGAFSSNSSVELCYLSFIGISAGTAFNCTGGRINSCYLHNLYFSGVPDQVFDFSGNLSYTYGDTTTYHIYNTVFDSITLNQCGFLIQGSFGTPASAGSPDVCSKVTISHLVDNNTTATFEPGKEVHGIFFHSTAFDWIVTSPAGAPNGDVGLLYGWGWWHEWNIYKNGGNGYISRLFPMQEAWDPGYSISYNCLKANTSEYGEFCYQYDTTGSVSGKYFGTDAWIFNNTAINLADNIGYWCAVCVNGQIAQNRHYWTSNNLGINLFTGGKAKIGLDNGGWTTCATDTSHNQYWNSMTQAKLDSITTLVTNSLGSFPVYKPTPTSPAILGTGIVNPYSTVDFFGVPYALVIGYAALPSIVPPCPNCIPLRWNTIAH